MTSNPKAYLSQYTVSRFDIAEHSEVETLGEDGGEKERRLRSEKRRGSSFQYVC